MNRFYFRDLLETNPTMLSSMMRFNTSETSGVSFDGTLEGPLVESIKSNRRLREAYEKRKIKSETKVTFWDFKDESERLVFLPSDRLERLGKLLAACVFGEEISKCLVKDEVFAVRDFLGDDIYRYALVRGRYQIGSFRRECTRMFGGEFLSDRCKNFAWGALTTLRSTWPDSLQEKAATLFDAINLPKTTEAKNLKENARRRLWELTKKLLTRELDQQWTRYFV